MRRMPRNRLRSARADIIADPIVPRRWPYRSAARGSDVAAGCRNPPSHTSAGGLRVGNFTLPGFVRDQLPERIFTSTGPKNVGALDANTFAILQPFARRRQASHSFLPSSQTSSCRIQMMNRDSSEVLYSGPPPLRCGAHSAKHCVSDRSVMRKSVPERSQCRGNLIAGHVHESAYPADTAAD